MSEQTTPSKKISVGLILSWIFGVLFALTGIISVFSEPIPGLVMLIMAAVLLPPITKLVDQKWKFHLSSGMKIVVIIIGFIIFGATIDTSNVSTTQQTEPQKEEQQTTQNEDIDYSILRQWYPDNDSQAVGLDILISESDATKEKILRLVSSLSSNTNKASIGIYQSKQAWNEDQSGNYSNIHKSGFLAIYIKNHSNFGAYKGFNEIRWMQENGNLQDLFGTETKM
jgi:predicted PurR-regulated permease PerM